MKKICLFTAAAVLVSGSVAWAGPKDKVAEALIDNSSIAGTPGVWDNLVAVGKVQMKGCKVKIQGKDLAAALEGEEIVCLAGADAKSAGLPPGGAGNSIILAGTVSGGKLKIKADMEGQIPCGAPGNTAIAYNANVQCYRQDLAYTGGGWIGACAPLPGIPIPGDGSDSFIGLCQGVVPGVRIPAPGSALLAVQGMLTPAP